MTEQHEVPEFHAFLSYNSKHVAEARVLDAYLSNSGVRVFFDRRCIPAGARYQKELEKALTLTETLIVLIGANGIGPWQSQEAYMAQILDAAHTASMRIIPVWLPGASPEAPAADVPLFLRQYQSIVFKDTVDELEPLFEIVNAMPRAVPGLEGFERPLLDKEEDALVLDSIEFYNKNAERYFEKWRHDLPVAPMAGFLAEVGRRVGKGAVILDAGCGPGHHARHFADLGHQVVGVDRAHKFLDIARATAVSGCRFMPGDLRRLHGVFKERNLFDAVWACGSCVHLGRESLEHQLYEFQAMLKPGGILGLSLQVEAPSVIQPDGRFFERYELAEVDRRLVTVGFETVRQNIELDSDSTTNDKLKVKKWYAVTALAPRNKLRLTIGAEGARR